MSDDALAAAPSSGTLFPALLDDAEPEFRVVVRGGTRRGIRLERFFWSALKRLAESRKSTLGQLVEEISQGQPETGNLTSAIRVACARSLSEHNEELRRLASLKTVSAILLACPSPAFALSSTRKILAFNPAFQLLVRRQLPVAHDDARHELKLALDLNVVDIFARLKAEGDRPVVTGFVLGAGERRYRAQLNVVRAPIGETEVLLAFVFGG